MPDTKISAAGGETGGPAETADLTNLFLRKDNVWSVPEYTLTASVPSTPAGQVSGYSGLGGNSVNGGGGIHATLNAQGLTTLQGGVVPGSVITAASTVANVSAETQLLGLSIPANDVVAGSTYLIKGSGVYSDTGTPTLAWGLRYGGAAGTSLATIAATTLGSSVSGLAFQVEAYVQFWSNILAQAVITVDLGTSNSSNATTRLTGSTVAAGVAVVSTSAKVLSVTITWSAASSSNTISALTTYGMRLA